MDDVTQRLNSALAGRYRLEGALGEGGMAVVYRAHDLRHDRPVALKVLRPELAHAIGNERFLREIRLTAQLDHPHILPLLDSGEADGLLYYVMPCVEGETLRERLGRERQLPLDESLRITCEVADALSYAHSHGIVHRDIKPENILLAGGHARVADFGIARAVTAAGGDSLTATGLVVGTPAYMSPEQAGGEPELDGRSDVYALGCVAYEMLAGHPPFTGGSAQEVLARHSVDAVPRLSAARPGVPPDVEAAIATALAKTPADRSRTAAQFAEALAGAGRGRTGVLAGTPRLGRRAPVAAVAVLLAAAGLVFIARSLGVGGGTLSKARGSAEAPIPSVAVLPLQNLSGDRAQEYFADGMTEALIASIASIRELRVISRTTVMRYKGTAKSVREIARELNVAAVMEGSVQQSADRVLITASLIDGRSDAHLWSETFHREIRDVLAVQRDVADAVARAIHIVASRAEPDVGSVRPVDPEAYRLYLQARHALNKRTLPEMNRALGVLEQVLEREPGFALAYAALSEGYSVLEDFGGALRRSSIRRPSRRRGARWRSRRISRTRTRPLVISSRTSASGTRRNASCAAPLV